MTYTKDEYDDYWYRFWADPKFYRVKEPVEKIDATIIPGVYYDLSTPEGRQKALDAIADADRIRAIAEKGE